MSLLSIYSMFTRCHFYGATPLRVQFPRVRVDHVLWRLLSIPITLPVSCLFPCWSLFTTSLFW